MCVASYGWTVQYLNTSFSSTSAISCSASNFCINASLIHARILPTFVLITKGIVNSANSKPLIANSVFLLHFCTASNDYATLNNG